MAVNIHEQRILILDFGSQYTQLIARRVREIGVYSEVRAYDMTEDEIREFAPKGIILAGSPESTTEEGSPRAPEVVFNLGVPVLGICYGMQTMAMQLGNNSAATAFGDTAQVDGLPIVDPNRGCKASFVDGEPEAVLEMPAFAAIR
jgi:GMP synthase (glutamine-hydrolysing)